MKTKETIALVRSTGCVCSRTEYGEFRVNLRQNQGGSEATAYYTDDAQDALETAWAMQKRYQEFGC